MPNLSLPFVGFERGYFLDIQCFFPNKQLIGHKILAGPCNCRCYYCHRRDFLEKRFPDVPVNEILIRLRELEYYNTVVVTGGEITLHFKAAISIMNALQAEGITTLFSTNGLFPDRVTAMCQYADAVKIDIKDTRGKYRDTSGQDAYDLVMESLSNASRFTNVEFKIIIHEHTTKDDIEAILRDVKSATGFPSNVAVQFQPVRDFLNAGLIEPSINNVMMMCAEANPRPQIALLKHYGTVERIYRLIDEDWIVFREKEIPLRFDWGTPHE